MAEQIEKDTEIDVAKNMLHPNPPMSSEVVTIAESAKTDADAFVVKHLHPPSSVMNYQGMPTNDTRTQVVTNWVQFGILDQSEVISSVPPGPNPIGNNQVSGIAFLVTSGMRFPYFTFVKYVDNNNETWRLDIRNSKQLEVYNVFDNLRNDAMTIRPAYRSMTTYLNATAFNDVGIASGIQFNPALLFRGTVSRLATTDYQIFKNWAKYHIKRGNTFHKSLLDELPGFIVVELKKMERELETFDTTNDKPEAIPDLQIQIIDFGRMGNLISGNQDGAIVPTQSQMMNLSARSYAGKARDGLYAVNRLNTLTPQWLPASKTEPAVNDYFECWYSFIDPMGNHNLYPFSHQPVQNAVICRDAPWSTDFTWTWMVYEGLSPNLTIGPNPSTQTVIYKLYMGYEIQPAAKSAWSGLQRLSPKPNMAAMQKLMDAYYEMKDCSIAADNFLAPVLGAVGRIGMRVARGAIGSAMHNKGSSLSNRFGRMSIKKGRRNNNRNRSKSRSRRGRSRGRSYSRGRSNSRKRSNSRQRQQFRPVKSMLFTNNKRKENREKDLVKKIDNIEKKVTYIEEELD